MAVHEEEVHRLYEETESQIRQERDKLMYQEKSRERELRNALETQLHEKDRALQDMVRQHEEVRNNTTLILRL